LCLRNQWYRTACGRKNGRGGSPGNVPNRTFATGACRTSIHAREGSSMDHRILMFAIVAAVLVLGYFVVMRVFYRDSKRLDNQVDLTKMKVWKDEE
jgi:hypothetical protein